MERVNSSLLDNVRGLTHVEKSLIRFEDALDLIRERLMVNNSEDRNDSEEVQAMRALVIREINYGSRSYFKPVLFGVLQALESLSDDY